MAAPTLAELGLDRLSVEDRIAVADAIWDSVAEAAATAPPSAEVIAELDRRLKDIRERPQDFIPWEEVKAELKARFGR